MVSGEGCGAGKSDRNADDDGVRVELEAVREPIRLTLESAPLGTLACREALGRELERTECRGTATAATTTVKTPMKIRELRRVTNRRGKFPVFIVGLSFRLDTGKRFYDLLFSRMVPNGYRSDTSICQKNGENTFRLSKGGGDSIHNPIDCQA